MIWEEEVRGSYPSPAVFALSGVEQLRSFFRQLSPPPPIAHLTGMFPTEVGLGTSTFVMPATRWWLAPSGQVQGGVLAILADGPLGSAIQSVLPPATPYTTSEMSMTFLRPIPAEGTTLVAHGKLVYAGKTQGLSEVAVVDGYGRLLAHGSSRCFVFPQIEGLEAGELEPVELPSYETPDPYLRDVEGEVLPSEMWTEFSGLEMLHRLIDEAVPFPPIYYLTGMRPTAASEGTATFVLPASEWLCSPLGLLEGGAIALIADSALATAVQTTVPAGSSYVTLDFKVNFLRPVSPDGRDLTATGVVVHRGKTIAVSSAEVFNADGKRVAWATGSSMISDHPPQPAQPPTLLRDA